MRGVGGGKTIVRIYSMKKHLFSTRKQKILVSTASLLCNPQWKGEKERRGILSKLPLLLVFREVVIAF